jgi:hypothetical protein
MCERALAHTQSHELGSPTCMISNCCRSLATTRAITQLTSGSVSIGAAPFAQFFSESNINTARARMSHTTLGQSQQQQLAFVRQCNNVSLRPPTLARRRLCLHTQIAFQHGSCSDRTAARDTSTRAHAPLTNRPCSCARDETTASYKTALTALTSRFGPTR